MANTGEHKSALRFLIPIGAIALVVLLIMFGIRQSGQEQVTSEELDVEDTEKPCEVTFNYELGYVDSNFEIDDHEINQAVNDAVDLWAVAVDTFALQYDKPGSAPINFHFDHRQRRTNKRIALDNRLDRYNSLIEELTKEYDRMEQKHQQAEDEYKTTLATYDAKFNDFNIWVASINDTGNWTEARTENYNREKEALQLNQRQVTLKLKEVNDYVDRLNALQNRINEHVRTQNELVDQVNDLASEDVMGTYECVARGDCRITVYAFEDYENLVLLLAHEIGHALGIDHVSDSTSLMYTSITENYSVKDFQLTDEDIHAVRERCR